MDDGNLKYVAAQIRVFRNARQLLIDKCGIDDKRFAAPEWAEPIWHLFVVEVSDRAGLQKALKAAQIETGFHYPIPLHRQPCYADLPAVALPDTERKAATILSLPMFAELTSDQINRVVEVIKEFQAR